MFKFKEIRVNSEIRYDNLIIKVLEIDKKVGLKNKEGTYIKEVEVIEETKIVKDD